MIDDKLKDILYKFNACEDYYDEEYNRNREDRDFLLGDQWEEEIKSQRRSEGRPCLTENRLLAFAHQVVNDIRKAKPSIIVHPVDDEADTETAEVIQGLIRNIEYINDAESVYDTSAFNGISSGRGYIRIGTKYADEYSFKQEITIERILDGFSVYFDPMSQNKDYSDAEYCFEFTDLTKDDFEEKYPDAMVEGWTEEIQGGWNDSDRIRVARYWYKHYETKKLVEYSIFVGGEEFDGVGYADEVPEGAEEKRSRNVEVCSIKWCDTNGNEILEEGEFLGKSLPIVPVLGFEAWYNNKRQVYTLINQAKDPQRMFNYWKSASTEIIALQPKAPWVVAEGQIAGFEEKWRDANRKTFSTLPYKPVTIDGVLAPPPSRQPAPTGSMTMIQEAMSAADGINATLGMYNANIGKETGDVSGKAIISRQMQGDNATYHFVDNLATALKRVGKILVDLIPLVYDDRQIVRIMGENGQPQMVPLNTPVIKQKDGYAKSQYIPNKTSRISLEAGKYDVVVEIGTSYATKRQELANMIVEIGRARPEIWEIAGDVFMENLDIAGSDKLAKRIQATMNPEMLGDDLEAQRLQQLTTALQEMQTKLEQTELALQVKQEDKQFENQLELQKIENQRKELEIKAMKTMAEINKLNADADKSQAEADQKIPAEALNETSEAVKRLQEEMEDVSNAMMLFIEREEQMASGEPEESPVTEKE